MSKDYATYDYESTSFHSPIKTDFPFWEQADGPFAPVPIRSLPQTHTSCQSQQAAPLTRSVSHSEATRCHRRIQKKQCSYDLHEDFIHHAPTEQGGFVDGGVSDVPSSPRSTLSHTTSSSRTFKSSVPSALLSDTELSNIGSHRSRAIAHSSPITTPPSQPKSHDALTMVSKKNTSWPLLRIKSTKASHQS